MSDKKILTLAVLGAALVELMAKTKGSTLEPDFTAFATDFDAYCNQPVDLDQTAIKDLQEKNEAFQSAIDQYQVNQQEAMNVIQSLKGSLSTAQAAKAAVSEKAVVDIDGVDYQINHGAYPHSIKDLQDNPDLVKEILLINGQQAVTKL